MSFAFAGLNILLLIYLAHRDFWHLHVPNRGMFALLVVWGAQLYWMQPDDWFFNLLTGAGFFAVGILFWRWRKISASEAKLLLVVGLILGWPCCLVFVVLLPITLILQFAFLRRWELTGRSHHIVLRRLRLLIKKKRLPAGLSIVAAAIISQFYLLLTS